MNDNIKHLLDNELSENVKEALSVAATALYFDDNSDYETALWEVVMVLLEGLVPCEAGDEFIGELAGYLNHDLNTRGEK